MLTIKKIEPEIDIDPLAKSLREQLKYEINGVELTNPEKFALEMKFGITEPFLLQEEKDVIAAEEAANGRA